MLSQLCVMTRKLCVQSATPAMANSLMEVASLRPSLGVTHVTLWGLQETTLLCQEHYQRHSDGAAQLVTAEVLRFV